MAPQSLSVPRTKSRIGFDKLFDGESFGTWSEQFARYLGTSKFLIQMSVFIGAWLAWNFLAPRPLRFDAYPLQFLTLLLSLQASYAAPLILLAQNRQDDRDRTEARSERERARVGVEVNSFLARELSDMRGKLNEISADVGERQTKAAQKSSNKDVMKRLDKMEETLALVLTRLEPGRAASSAG